MRQFLFAPVAVALMSLALTSQAAVTLKLDGYKVDTFTPTTGSGAANSVSNVARSRTFGFNLASGVGTITQDIAGQFGGSITQNGATSSFSAFCTELTQGFSAFPTGDLSYEITDGLTKYGSVVNGRLVKLFSEGVVFDSADKTAAFQIAIWESIYETSNTLDVSTGTARFSLAGSNATAAQLSFAQQYLAAIPGTTIDINKSTLLIYVNNTSQDLVVAVPEPSTYALMFAGLAGMGGLAVRRARQQR